MTVLALLALLALPSLAGGALGDGSQDLARRAAQAKDVADNPIAKDETISRLGRNILESGTVKVVVEAGLRGWDMEPKPQEDPATIARIIRSADKRYTYYSPNVPEPDLKDAYTSATELNRHGRMNYDSSMPDNQMGAYQYRLDDKSVGQVKINDWIARLSTTIGDVFAFATLIHEAAHADRHKKGRLSPDAVIAGEVASFFVEYAWLKLVDPHGERLAFLLAGALDSQKRAPSALHDMTVLYLTHLYEVWWTAGDLGKLEDLVRKSGYEEKSEDHEGPNPVRS